MFDLSLYPPKEEWRERMLKSPIAFQFTSDWYEWERTAAVHGPYTVYDRWTYGRCLTEPNSYPATVNGKETLITSTRMCI